MFSIGYAQSMGLSLVVNCHIVAGSCITPIKLCCFANPQHTPVFWRQTDRARCLFHAFESIFRFAYAKRMIWRRCCIYVECVIRSPCAQFGHAKCKIVKATWRKIRHGIYGFIVWLAIWNGGRLWRLLCALVVGRDLGGVVGAVLCSVIDNACLPMVHA